MEHNPLQERVRGSFLEQMKSLVALGMVIVFISALFILLSYEFLIRENLDCIVFCGMESLVRFLVGVFTVGAFLVVGILTVYIIFSNYRAITRAG